MENLKYDLVDYSAHYHCANFCGDRAIHGRDLKGGPYRPPPPPPSFSSYQNSPVFLGLRAEIFLLDSDGHVRLTDFGLCKEGIAAKKTTSTFCDTPEVSLGLGLWLDLVRFRVSVSLRNSCKYLQSRQNSYFSS